MIKFTADLHLLDLEKILQKNWGFSSFRPLQKEIITAVLSGNNVMALLPTGGGKSICYQLPALVNEGCCIVVSPLIALMQDQVKRLQSLHITAACLHAGMHFTEVTRCLENARGGAYKLLYVSPERLQSFHFNEYLPDIPVNLLAIDEAHCISQWGHDFRPDYLKIVSLKKTFPTLPVLALTATATQEVQEDILLQLQLEHPVFFKQSFKRENIFYTVKHSDKKVAETAQHLKPDTTSLVYCRSRKQTELLAKNLTHQHIPTLHYHAGMDKKARETAQEQWMNDKVKNMVATTAFGMGIDKPNVRMVLHYEAPEHLEAYYQEAGRAGRDHLPSNALLLWDKKDITRLQESTELKFPNEAYLRKVYQAVCDYLQIAIGTTLDHYFDFDIIEFCKNFSFEIVPALAALKLLEQEELWTLSDAFYKPPTVKIIAERNVIDQLSLQHPLLGMICVHLLRMYASIFYAPISVSLSQIAKKCNLPITTIENGLQQLHLMNVLLFTPSTDKPQLFFHHYRVDNQHLIINTKRINSLRQQHQKRTEKMIVFLQNETVCRERLLLHYFDEPTTKDCGHCDTCMNKQNKTESLKTIREKLILHCAANGSSLQMLLLHFPHHSEDTVIQVLRQLMDEGVIKRTAERFYSKRN